MHAFHTDKNRLSIPLISKRSKRQIDADKAMRSYLNRRRRNIGEGEDVEGFSRECMINGKGSVT